MKKIPILCLTVALFCVGCSDDSQSKMESSGIETSATTDRFDDEQESDSETTAATNNLAIITEISCDEKEFIVTEPNEESTATTVSTTYNLKPNQSKTETTVSPVSTTETPAKTYIITTTQVVEKTTETTTAETESGVIELPFVPIG